MNRNFVSVLFVVVTFAVACSALAQQKVAPVPQKAAQPAHDHSAFKPKFNQVVVEFPGHKYALEIFEAEKTVGKENTKVHYVKAIATDAHFEPIAVPVPSVNLYFPIKGKMKMYTLARVVEDPKAPVAPAAAPANAAPRPTEFESNDPELVKLICEGWQGEAAAMMTVGKTPFKAKLVNVAKHGHVGHSH